MHPLKSLIAPSRKLFGTGRNTRGLRHQWVLKTNELMTRKIHLRQVGKFPGKVDPSHATEPYVIGNPVTKVIS